MIGQIPAFRLKTAEDAPFAYVEARECRHDIVGLRTGRVSDRGDSELILSKGDTMIEATYTLEDTTHWSERAFVLSGCSGGGKSTLLSGLALHGVAVAEEAGRQIVREQMAIAGPALPYADPRLFVELLVSRAIQQWAAAKRHGQTTVFDRSVIDGISFLEHLRLDIPDHIIRAGERIRYNRTVLMVPPWPELFAGDAERRHGFEDAAAQFSTLIGTYERFGYSVALLPKTDIHSRLAHVLALIDG
jgi:predicted ATPase